jgi:hypothetical protein
MPKGTWERWSMWGKVRGYQFADGRMVELLIQTAIGSEMAQWLNGATTNNECNGVLLIN